MKNKRFLLFDLDRTLWDFEANADCTYHEMFDHYGLANLCHVDYQTFHERYEQINDMLWEAYRNGTVSKERLAVNRFSLTLAAFGLDPNAPTTIRLSRKMGEYYVQEGPRQTRLMPGAMELLQWLKTVGCYHLAVITNGFAEAQLPKMRTSGIDHYFDYIFLSETLGVMKPSPRFFEIAMAKMDANPEECVVIGDDYHVDIVGAARAGIDQVYYNCTEKMLSPELTPPTYEINHLLQLKQLVINEL